MRVETSSHCTPRVEPPQDAGSHLEMLKWAREDHCPWREGTCGAPL
jgi:hypothetical protein